jgi:uncharacterized membrane protein
LAPNPVSENAVHRTPLKAVLLVFSCTIIGAVAQLFIKIGMAHFRPDLAALVTNFSLVAGYALYGINTVLLVLALRDGELSTLYPIIALTYVWVTLLSYTLLGEKPSLFKDVGIGLIVVGVAVLGRGERK